MTHPLSQLPPGASGYQMKPAEQILNEVSAGHSITEAADFFEKMEITYTLPSTLHTLDWWRPLNQGSVGRCFGYASGQSGEAEYHHATGNKIKFSGSACYLMTQQSMGADGVDSGSDPSVGIRVILEQGLVPNEVYGDEPDTYQGILERGVTGEMLAAAAKYKPAAIVRTTSLDEIKLALQTQGVHVQVNSRWTSAFDELPTRVDRFSGSGGGGHAYQLVDLNADTGEPVLANTWGSGWGQTGGKTMAWTAVEEMLQDAFTLIYFWSTEKTGTQREIKIVRSDWV